MENEIELTQVETWPHAVVAVAMLAADLCKIYLNKNESDRIKKIESELVSIRNGLAFKG